MFHTGSLFSATAINWKSLFNIQNKNPPYTIETCYNQFIWSLQAIHWSCTFHKFIFTHGVLLTFKTLLLHRDVPFVAKKNDRPVGKVYDEAQYHDGYCHRQTHLEFHTLHQSGLMNQITHSGVFCTLRCLKKQFTRFDWLTPGKCDSNFKSVIPEHML